MSEEEMGEKRAEYALKDADIMGLYGINPSSTDIVYVPNAPLRKKTKQASLEVAPYYFGAVDGAIHLFSEGEVDCGTVIVGESDLIDKVVPKHQIGIKDKREIIEAIGEYSKWLPVIEGAIDPSRTNNFYLSRLVLASRLFMHLQAKEMWQIKVNTVSSLQSRDDQGLRQTLDTLEGEVESFCSDNPEFLDYFGISENYLHRLLQAEIFIPTLISNPNNDLALEILQETAKDDISTLTAYMMYRTTRYLTGEARTSSQLDAKTSQEISAAEIPPDEFLPGDNIRRMHYANMLGLYQDVTFREAFPHVFSLGEKRLRKILPNCEYLAGRHYLSSSILDAFRADPAIFYDQTAWVEAGTKSVVSTIRQATLPSSRAIERKANELDLKIPETTHPRLALFQQLEHLLENPQETDIPDIQRSIESRMRNAEVLRLRIFLNEEEFDPFVREHIAESGTPTLVIDTYRDGEKVADASSAEKLEITDENILVTLRKSQSRALASSGVGEKLVYTALHWELEYKGVKVEVQVAPEEFLEDNYESRKVYLQ